MSEYDGTTWRTHTVVDGLTSDTVRAIAVDSQGHIWCGTTDGGVSEYDGATWQTYTTADGLAGNRVYSIAADHQGHLWFGAYSAGLSEYDGSTWRTYTTAEGVPSSGVEYNAITVDDDGHLWLGTMGGALRLRDYVLSVDPEETLVHRGEESWHTIPSPSPHVKTARRPSPSA